MLCTESQAESMFKFLQQREGCTPAKLKERLAGNAGTLLDVIEHDFFTTIVSESEHELHGALIAYCKAVCKQLDPVTVQIVDELLALGFDGKQGYAANLTDRRADVYKQLQNGPASIYDIPMPKSESSFRANIEPKARAKFCSVFIRPNQSVIQDLGIADAHFAKFIEQPEQPVVPDVRPTRSVIVLGAAVMDLNFRVPQMPKPSQSVQARQFKIHPGGKGLTQAVACARLGLETKLISIVGDDQFGKQIIEYLQAENVNTSLIKIKSGGVSPVTAVFNEDQSRMNMAIGWKNEERLHFDDDLLEEPARASALKEAAFLLASFELPASSVEKAISLTKSGGGQTIITPAPPYEQSILAPDQHANIDYLVANMWELSMFAEGALETELRPMAGQLIHQSKVKNVVVTHQQAAHAFSYDRTEAGQIRQYIRQTADHHMVESPGERDAFCAMLACKLALSEPDMKNQASAIDWAVMAMSRVNQSLAIPNSMPSLGDIERLMTELETETEEK